MYFNIQRSYRLNCYRCLVTSHCWANSLTKVWNDISLMWLYVEHRQEFETNLNLKSSEKEKNHIFSVFWRMKKWNEKYHINHIEFYNICYYTVVIWRKVAVSAFSEHSLCLIKVAYNIFIKRNNNDKNYLILIILSVLKSVLQKHLLYI